MTAHPPPDVHVHASWNGPLRSVFVGSNIDHRDRLLSVEPRPQGVDINLLCHDY